MRLKYILALRGPLYSLLACACMRADVCAQCRVCRVRCVSQCRESAVSRVCASVPNWHTQFANIRRRHQIHAARTNTLSGPKSPYPYKKNMCCVRESLSCCIDGTNTFARRHVKRASQETPLRCRPRRTRRVGPSRSAYSRRTTYGWPAPHIRATTGGWRRCRTGRASVGPTARGIDARRRRRNRRRLVGVGRGRG